jgi:hypothetical protein
MSSATTQLHSVLNGTGLVPQFQAALLKEKSFLGFLIITMALGALVTPYPTLAMWFGFIFAGYSAIANDSIQTLGTFIASNRHRPWWVLWLFIGGIWLFIVSLGYWLNAGDVAWGRLSRFPQPQSLNYLQVIAPLFLLVLTRLRMPVSTTVLLLTSFATTSADIGGVLQKSMVAYVLAFFMAIAVWGLLGRPMQRWFRGTPSPWWTVVQWCTTGGLWSLWLIQDAANIAVFLPRQLTFLEFTVFAGVMFAGMMLIFYGSGERIQQVVEEKNEVFDVRPATVIDFIYGLILLIKTLDSRIPMSTTWVFIGLLGGREVAMAWARVNSRRTIGQAFWLMGKDLLKVTIGLLISLLLALAINPVLRETCFGLCR